MSVVNCKSIRPTYVNLKEWLRNPQNVYITHRGNRMIDGERCPKADSIWANPFKLGRDGTQEEIIRAYALLMRDRVLADPLLRLELMGLKGKTLGCWCAPEPCHGDALLQLIEELGS